MFGNKHECAGVDAVPKVKDIGSPGVLSPSSGVLSPSSGPRSSVKSSPQGEMILSYVIASMTFNWRREKLRQQAHAAFGQ